MSALSLPDGSSVPVTIERHRRARRMVLRVGAIDGEVRLVLPRGASVAAGLAFARSKSAWIARRRNLVPQPIAFADGAEIPFLGQNVVIRHAPELRRNASRHGDLLSVSGAIDEIGRTVRDWLILQARSEVGQRATRHATVVARPFGRIRIGDPKTRWGSCSPAGDLSFSWRLVLAPESVLDYVVAHEVAHLVAPNHGPGFWSLVYRIYGDADPPRRWLRDHGTALHRYV